jgi:hypothetical protein
MKTIRSSRIVLSILVVCSFSGCPRASDPTIRGRVVTGTRDIVSSYMLVFIRDDPEQYPGVDGAVIQFSTDEHGENILLGYTTTTDADGYYTLSYSNIPPPPNNEKHCYYLIVKKDGYEALRASILLGPFCDYSTNTVILKPKD